VGVAGGLGVLVGVGVGIGEGLQPLRKGDRISPLMTQRQRKTLVLETALAPIMIVLTSGKGFRMARHIISHLTQLDHFSRSVLAQRTSGEYEGCTLAFPFPSTGHGLR
jgi:hypothetical protein